MILDHHGFFFLHDDIIRKYRIFYHHQEITIDCDDNGNGPWSRRKKSGRITIKILKLLRNKKKSLVEIVIKRLI